MQYFDADFLGFFRELAANNKREWFKARKKRYEESVKQPFERLIEDLGQEMQRIEPGIDLRLPKELIFRIYKDSRFSKDKTPYKLHASAILSSKGRKAIDWPAYYLQFGPAGVWVGGGAYRLSPAQVLAVREAILDQRDSFEHLLVQPAFEQYYPAGLQGEKHKRIPKQFRALGEELPMIYQKQYYFMRTYEEEAEMDEILQSKELLSWLLEHFEAAMGINRFLREALAGE